MFSVITLLKTEMLQALLFYFIDGIEISCFYEAYFCTFLNAIWFDSRIVFLITVEINQV
jgi:hypothetical protein